MIKDMKKIYFIGIGGISMSGIALLLKERGCDVLGSDITETSITLILEEKGIKIDYSQSGSLLSKDIDLVVCTAAIKDDNFEFLKAKKMGLNIIYRSKLLGEIMKDYKIRINVAGTHGKTTTTSMISKVLIDEKLNPTVSIGGVYEYINGNMYIGGNEIFLTEACEYTNSFLDFFPTCEVITNIEEDHLDFFKDINDIRNSFKKFINLMDENSMLIINNRIDDINYLIKDYKGKVIYYGFDNKGYHPLNVENGDSNHYHYDLYNGSEYIGKVNLNILGIHNVENSVAVFATLLNMGIPFEDISKSIEEFYGTERRLEYKGEVNKVKVYDDYAHHPSEIRASIKALKPLLNNNQKMYLVFQPHTYTRTKALFDEFADVLSEVEDLIIIDIYAAREKNEYNISSNDLVMNINNKYNKHAIYIKEMDAAVKFLCDKIKPFDIVVTMGAGDVYKVADNFINIMKNKNNI